jgi:flagellar biogenesis protein FliO
MTLFYVALCLLVVIALIAFVDWVLRRDRREYDAMIADRAKRHHSINAPRTFR